MNAVSLNNLWTYLSGLSLTAQNRRWLSEKLIEFDNKKGEASSSYPLRTLDGCSESDKDFISRFLATPYDNPTTAEEEIKIIRDSHYFDSNRKVNHINYEG